MSKLKTKANCSFSYIKKKEEEEKNKEVANMGTTCNTGIPNLSASVTVGCSASNAAL